ncbi:hypothetical protein G7062_11000 [Erysipelothrix sp. HDW6C]|uniref:SIR2 family protein n=1 Tax=Erysipelothrix sp. HDW6C TaxID=2714930 RepID=UPI0014096159|nr:SIR2 family protein [Erysipelothrix sp. HDW6C]QIK70787.1 hypothetical protein G7062_11000 [Erysipelothrix sp. HDW6C]
MNRQTLFIGNGLNRVYEGPSWNDVLVKIDAQAANDSIDPNLPPTLLFEYITNALYQSGSASVSYDAINETLAEIFQKIPKIGSEDLRRKFTHLSISNIITPNYDYILEATLDDAFTVDTSAINRYPNSRDETRYSAERYIEVNKKRIFHIHGEALRPKSICLGYDHYVGNLSKMTQALERIEDITDVSKIFKKFRFERWFELFFTTDVHLVGYGLDYSELDVWWILSLRTRLMNMKPQLVTNTITYYEVNGSDAKETTLQSFNVETVMVKAQSYAEGYPSIYKMIRTSINK